jgi:phospholipid/cholesterol/gamma-HCH transport system ATP-binding protein
VDSKKILNISNLYKSFEDKEVIKGVNLSLFAGENLVVLGKSGAGKSVVMKCIVRLMDPDGGEIDVLGTDVIHCTEVELNQVRNRIGYLFQEGAMYDSMTVRENLIFPAKRNPKLRKLAEAELEDLVVYNLESVGLLDAIDLLPSELSGGMKKRAGLARTLMLSPEMIIYDEPTTGLDPFTGDAILELIMKVKEIYNTSSIIITHDIKCARRTSDRMMIMKDGKIIAEGTFDELEANTDEEVKLFFN